MNQQEKKIASDSGYELALTILEPEEAAKGVIQINTGTCIPQRIYHKFARYLTRHGYITTTYDYSDAQNLRSEVSHLHWYKDMSSVFNYILEVYPDKRKIMVGHSSGGQFIGTIPQAAKIDKIYLVAASNGYWKNMNFPFKYVMCSRVSSCRFCGKSRYKHITVPSRRKWWPTICRATGWPIKKPAGLY